MSRDGKQIPIKRWNHYYSLYGSRQSYVKRSKRKQRQRTRLTLNQTARLYNSGFDIEEFDDHEPNPFVQSGNSCWRYWWLW